LKGSKYYHLTVTVQEISANWSMQWILGFTNLTELNDLKTKEKPFKYFIFWKASGTVFPAWLSHSLR